MITYEYELLDSNGNILAVGLVQNEDEKSAENTIRNAYKWEADITFNKVILCELCSVSINNSHGVSYLEFCRL